jgi:hypothetical protein
MLRTINATTVVGAIVLLVLGLWPGYAVGMWVLLALPLAVVLGVGWLIQMIRLAGPSGPRSTLRQAVLAPAVFTATLILLVSFLPLRVGFLTCRSEFDALVPSAVASVADRDGAFPERRIGIYRVDEILADPRGGIYFRTGTGPTLGPDQMTYGFAYRPNGKGSPFGAAEYVVRRVWGDWYWFQASDDSH